MIIYLSVLSLSLVTLGLPLLARGLFCRAKAHKRYDPVEGFNANVMIAVGSAALLAAAAMAGVPLAHIIR